MRKQKFINWLLFAVVICVSCGNTVSNGQEKPEKQQLREKLIGSWAGAWLNKYGELHFLNDSTYIPIQEFIPFYFPYKYSFVNDSLQLGDYRIYSLSIIGDTLELKEDERIYKYERIKNELDSVSLQFLKGDMIRRCNFLVLKGILSVPEAYKQLYDYIEGENLLDTTNYDIEDVEDEYIPIEIAP